MAHRIDVGDVQIISLLDVGNWTLAGFFPTVPAELWEEYRAIYPDALLEHNSIATSATCYAVRSRSQTILLDAGLGPGPHERAGGQRGQLLEELRSVGIAPSDVDVVAMTHLHRDHVGWNALLHEGGAKPTFPRARYLAPRKDWAHFERPEIRERSPYLAGTIALFEKGLIELVDGEHSVSAEVTLVPTPGHTPGHQAAMIASRGERAMVIGDVAHTPPQVQEIEWSASADVDAEAACRTRQATFDRAEAERLLLCANHFPHPGFGRLVRLNGRRVFQAL